jgi:hypothetical protein
MVMAHKNLEEAMVDRIQRAIAKEWKRVHQTYGSKGHRPVTGRVVVRGPELMAKDAGTKGIRGGNA